MDAEDSLKPDSAGSPEKGPLPTEVNTSDSGGPAQSGEIASRDGSAKAEAKAPTSGAEGTSRLARIRSAISRAWSDLRGRGSETAGNSDAAKISSHDSGANSSSGDAANQSTSTGGDAKDHQECDRAEYRCPVCNRLACRENCVICETDNGRWLDFGNWGDIARFPVIILLLAGAAFGVQLLFFWSSFRSQDPPFSTPLIAMAILSVLASLIIVLLIVVFRRALRNHELLRQAKRKRRGLSLVALGALCFGVLLLILATSAALSFTVRDYVMGGPWTLTIQDIGGVSRRVLAPSSAPISQPQWSPEGDKLLFSSKRSGGKDWEVYTLDVVTGTIKMLTNNTTQDVLPTWLEDGTIVYASDRTGNFEWYRMEASGEKSAVGPLGEWRETVSMSWSPDGNSFAFTEPGRAAYFAIESLLTIEERHPLILSITASVMFPLLVLSLMLFGAAGYVKRLDEEIHRPVFLNDRKMVKVAFDSFLEEMRTRLRDGKDALPSNAQADVYSFERTAAGGMKIIISYKVEVEEKDDKGGRRTVAKEVFYEVLANEWAEIRSIQRLDPRRMVSRQV